jgi:carboxymethylenebutenolidase
LVVHIAGLDQYCPPEAQQKIIKGLAKHEDIEVHLYPSADHAFARPAGDHYHAESAQLAEQRSLAALHDEIGP